MVQIEVLGIRHHGPGSARLVRAALGELMPTAVLIEGPPELDAVAPLAREYSMKPPVAGLVYAVEEPRRAYFYPMAAFSPEWIALRWAYQNGAVVRFADLPAANSLAKPSEDDLAAAKLVARRPDPITELSRLAGYEDPERWWEDAIEHRGAGSPRARFEAVASAMALYRETGTESEASFDHIENERREASMRRILREVVAQGHERIAFVCGAYHAPALRDLAAKPATADTKTLAGLSKAKVAATWAPWTADRLATVSGYGAGVTSPGWYQHLFVTPTEVVVPSWMARVAKALRNEQFDASTASVVEAARLATSLAALRGRPMVGLEELNDATQAVLCEGSVLPLQLIVRELIIGQEMGEIPESTPMVPIAADLAKLAKTLRLKQSASEEVLTLDLRRDAQLARSVLFHRLALLDVAWAREADVGRSLGTFKEGWLVAWRPELTVALIDASRWGTTVEAAALAKLQADAAAATELAALGRSIEQTLLADLTPALDAIVAALQERAARQHDTLALLSIIEPLSRTCRYGDVRGADVSAIRSLLGELTARAAIGLRAACVNLDDDAAAALRAAVDGAQRGVNLLEDAELRRPFDEALAFVATQDGVHGSISGRVNRMLLDAGLLDTADAGARLSRQLSLGADPAVAAAWLDGFLSGEAILLLHDDALLSTIDEWVAGIGEEIFEDLLPLLRRTFSRYSAPERRQLGEHLKHSGSGVARRHEAGDIDLDRALPAMRKVAELLGLRGASRSEAQSVGLRELA